MVIAIKTEATIVFSTSYIERCVEQVIKHNRKSKLLGSFYRNMLPDFLTSMVRILSEKGQKLKRVNLLSSSRI